MSEVLAGFPVDDHLALGLFGQVDEWDVEDWIGFLGWPRSPNQLRKNE